jgi:hypothetical protein
MGKLLRPARIDCKGTFSITFTAVNIRPCRAVDDHVWALALETCADLCGVRDVKALVVVREDLIAVCAEVFDDGSTDHPVRACDRDPQRDPTSTPYCLA